MDIYCPRCAEPCDIDELHDIPHLTFDQASQVFFDPRVGCGQLFSRKPCERSNSPVARAAAAMHDMFGDDIDGIAAMMENFMEGPDSLL